MIPDFALEARTIVVLAFRNGPIERLHAGRTCPTCAHDDAYSRISQAEMKEIMKNAVDHTYRLLWSREHNPKRFKRDLAYGKELTEAWDRPASVRPKERRPANSRSRRSIKSA